MRDQIFIKIYFTILVLLFLTGTASAASSPPQKFKRGVINIVTAPLEPIKQSRVYWKEGAKKTDHILVWIFAGFVKGVANIIPREISGVWDVLTFPFEMPADYEPLFKPDTVFD